MRYAAIKHAFLVAFFAAGRPRWPRAGPPWVLALALEVMAGG
jgi:hypothetical protein